MIGNDIIDLSLARTQSNWERKGFLEKQFTQKEQQLISSTRDSFEMVWRLWSMKEAAYKIVVQQLEKRFFAPKKLECQIISETEGEVTFENQTFKTNTRASRKYMYTVAGEEEVGWLGKLLTGEELKQEIGAKVGLIPSEIQIKKNAIGVPTIYHKGCRISRSFTKTHHGNYSAFELIPIL